MTPKLKTRRSGEAEVAFEDNGLRSHFEVRDSQGQEVPHSHNEIEVLLLEKGAGEWMIGGNRVKLGARHLAVFWAIRPHRAVSTAPGTAIHWLTIPLTVFLEWRLPQNLARSLMSGAVVEEPSDQAYGPDRLCFDSWHQDLRAQDSRRQKLALLEIEARLGRLAYRNTTRLAKPAKGAQFNYSHFQKAASIAEYVSIHYADSISVEDIAKHVGMRPSSASRMFKKICHTNLSGFLLQHRIQHAQRLLASTDMKILDVAHASGYRTASRFYAAFRKHCRESPDVYRRRHENGQHP